MAISPPSDIVLDVARAVEPAGMEVARARLATRGNGAAATGSYSAFSLGDMQSSNAGTAGSGNGKTTPETFVRFEAMVLQSFIQSMLPKEADAVYGGGMAGDMWQSMLAQQLSGVMAERGGIGIADRILSDHYIEGKTKVAVNGVSSGPEKTATDQQDMLSTALVQEMQRKLAKSLAEDQASASTGAKP